MIFVFFDKSNTPRKMGHKSLACLSVFCTLVAFFATASGDCGTAKASPKIPKPDADYKDVEIVNGELCARLYVPKSAADPNNNNTKKLPLVVYYHGGGFSMFSAFLPPYDDYVYSLVKKANVVALSVEYSLVATHPLPAAYDDAWAALKWVASHSAGRGLEEMVNKHVDFNRVFFAGDSVGANLAYNMVTRLEKGSEKLDGVDLSGIVLLHPYFWGAKPIGDHEPKSEADRSNANLIWSGSWGGTAVGLDDPRVNPLQDPKLPAFRCPKVLVSIASGDNLYRDRGYYFYKALLTDGWKGKIQLVETPGTHTFFLQHPNTTDAIKILDSVSSFLNN